MLTVLIFFLLSQVIYSSGYYDLSGNVSEITLPSSEKKLLEALIGEFLTRVKNQQLHVIADKLLFIPDITFQRRPLNQAEIQSIKNSFLEGLSCDHKFLKKAKLIEIRKFIITGPAYALSKNKEDNIGFDINLQIEGGKKFIKYKLLDSKGNPINVFKKIAPMHIFVTKKNGKFMISSYDLWMNYPLVKVVPEYPISVDPGAD